MSQAFKRNGWVWIGDADDVFVSRHDEPICLDEKPDGTVRESLEAHLADQRAYIARLTERADKIEAFLKTEKA